MGERRGGCILVGIHYEKRPLGRPSFLTLLEWCSDELFNENVIL
jgi:hypothetical protein